MRANRPCQFFDIVTLKYYIETNRNGLAIIAKREWEYRWGTEYPQEGEQEKNKKKA